MMRITTLHAAKECAMRRLIIAEGRQEIGHLAHHMSSLVHHIIHSGFPSSSKTDWTPAVDIYETEESYEVIVELAGVTREHIEVYADTRVLTVAGWRADPVPAGKVCVHQMEIEQGQFRRCLGLPGDADTDRVTARYHDGLLLISIPKRPRTAIQP
jgi:HSP20 family protein